MSALARGNDSALVELPREVWSRGSRPLQGRAMRWLIASSIVLLGLTFPMLPVRIGALAIAGLFFFGVYRVVDSRLEALGKELAGASRGEAGKLMAGLEERWMVSRFAPHVWVSAQKGRLNIIKGDSRAAATAFAEAARLSGNAHQPDLIGSQAHALALSGDPKGARILLTGMEERKELRALDAFNLGVAYVEEPGKTSRAVELLESARKDLGPGPRTDAALALAYARDGQTAEAASLLDALDDSSFSDDDVATGLHKRARRSLRQATDAKGVKGKRKSAPATADAADGETHGKGKRDRRKERREKRKARGGKKKTRSGKPSDDQPAIAPEVKTAPAPAKAETSAAEEAAAQKAAEEKAAEEKAAAAKAAEEKAAEEKAAEEKAAEEKAAEEKAAEEKAAEEKAAAQKAAEEKAAEEKAAQEREVRANAVAEALARSAADDDPASEEKAKAEAEAAARAAAERARERAEAKAKEQASPEKPLFGSDSQPLFVPPPVPAFGSDTGLGSRPSSATKSAAPKLPAPPKVSAPKVAAPPVLDSAPKKPAIDTEGWGDLFGDD